MIEYYTIAFVVGKTFIRSALLEENGNILPDSFSVFSSKSVESKESLLHHFVNLIKFNINSVLHPHFKIQQIVFTGLPVVGVNPTETLKYKEELHTLLMQVPSIQGKLSENCQLHFKEDAPLFAIGEHILRKKENQNKSVLYLILGDHLGYAFLVNGQLIRVPHRLFDNKCADENIDASLSKKDFLQLAHSYGIQLHHKEFKELAERAKKKQPEAVKVFEQFGELLAAVLEGVLLEVAPDEIILGGHLAGSYPLFQASLLRALKQPDIEITPVKYTTYYLFFGLSEYIKKRNH